MFESAVTRRIPIEPHGEPDPASEPPPSARRRSCPHRGRPVPRVRIQPEGPRLSHTAIRGFPNATDPKLIGWTITPASVPAGVVEPRDAQWRRSPDSASGSCGRVDRARLRGRDADDVLVGVRVQRDIRLERAGGDRAGRLRLEGGDVGARQDAAVEPDLRGLAVERLTSGRASEEERRRERPGAATDNPSDSPRSVPSR